MLTQEDKDWFREELKRAQSSERLDKIEFLTAGWIEQSKREHEENRRLWREMGERMDARDKAYREEQARLDEGYRIRQEARDKAYREEQAERDRKIDERIDKLVSAIGELVRRQP